MSLNVEKMARRFMWGPSLKPPHGMPDDGEGNPVVKATEKDLADFARTVARACARVAETCPLPRRITRRIDAATAIRHAVARKGKGR